MRWHRRSAGGTRLALQRKFEINVAHYGGAVALLTLTGLGKDQLPWDTDVCREEGPHTCSGDLGCRVEWIYAEVYNRTAQGRASRLFEAATRSADRFVRRQWGGELPRQVGNVGKCLQLRGVFHFHWLMPMGSEVERAWTRHVRRFMENALKREARLGQAAIWEALEREYMTGEITRGVYGFGFSHPGRRRSTAEEVARYMARNAAGYVAGNPGRHYVSAKLTEATGATMRALRGVNLLHVRRKLVALGELDETVPGWWSDEWKAQVLGLLELVQPRGP